MNKEIGSKAAARAISERITGSHIDKVSYYITGWELRFTGSDNPIFELIAAEISAPEIEQWWSRLEDFPIDIKGTNEPEDTLIAIHIFTLINKWPVTSVDVDSENNLILKFSNEMILFIPSEVELVDWTWSLNHENGDNLITCDSGRIFGNAELSEKE